MRRTLERLRLSGGGRWLAVGVLGAAGLAAAAWGGDAGGAALGALAALGLLGGGAMALSRRAGSGPAEGLLAVEARAALGRDTGLALVRASGRRFLVGYGPGGASALAELDGREAGP
ncbi:MAG TPA: flagellar biosynthetic protein FliO [Anaeromyxobacteraceae bacterium]|nr:flagellar biosynthetic protein FliO [Anaeromyxobacteraceae bacterium]